MEVEMPWRPLYLQRKILASFAVVFAGLAVSIGALFDLSSKNSGLGTTTAAGHYLWRLVPTSLVTIMTVLWSRADYQAKHTAPWIRLARAPLPGRRDNDAEKTLLLDYLNMPQPQAIFRALRNQDYLVACTATVTLILRLLVVISTGLLTLSLITDNNSTSTSTVDVRLDTTFADNATDMTDNAGQLAFFTMVGLQQDHVYFPDGVSERFAFQRFSSDLPRGSIVKATVDGFSAGLDCEPATIGLTGVQVNRGVQQFNTSFSTEGGDCNITMPVSSEAFVPTKSAENGTTFYFARFGKGSCGGGSLNTTARLEDSRMVVVFGSATIDSASPAAENGGDGSSNVRLIGGNITQSAQMICTPTYSISRVDVTTQDGTVINITASTSDSDRQRNRTLANVQPWNLAGPFFASYSSESELASLYADTSPWFYQPDVVNVDTAMFLALDLRLRRAGTPTTPQDLLDPVTLQGVANDYFQQYAAVLASRTLTQPAGSGSSVSASATTMSERLRVSPLTAKLMIILMGITAALTAAAAFLAPKKGFLPRDPGTIMDTAALIANSRSLLQLLRGAGGADLQTLRARLAGSEYYTGVEAYERSAGTGTGYYKIFGGHGILQDGNTPEYVEPTDKFPYPALLHPVQRALAFLLAIGLIVGLDLSLQSSKRNGGLADADDDTYPHLLWTVVPAMGIGSIALYFTVADFMISSLAPFAALRRGATLEQSIGVNLVDRATPVVLYRALKSRNLAVGGASLAALLSSLFVIFAATLFSAATVPATAQCQLLSRDFFSQSNGIPDPGFCTSCQNGTVLSSLVLDANISFPDFTYEDLAYPTMTLENVPDDIDLPDDLVIVATVPAVRSVMRCQTYRQSELVTNLTTGSTIDGLVNPLQIILPGEADLDENTLAISTAQNLDSFGNVLLGTIDRNAFFGAGAYKPLAASNNTTASTPVSRWVYVWGQLRDAGTDAVSVKSISALACNETMQQVNVATSFIGSDLHIDTTFKPPVVDEATAFATPIAIDGNLDYSELVQLSTPHLLDPFFSSLVSSRSAIPVAAFSSSEIPQIQSVADAITRQHKLIRAQIVSTWNRRPTVSGGTALPQSAIFPTDAAGSGAARRVVQDTASTRILQALLSATVLAAAASWLALPKPNGVLPRPPTSIASVAALLADGNMFGLLGRGAEWLDSRKDLTEFFKDGLHVTMGFRLDWEKVRNRRGERSFVTSSPLEKDEVFGVSAIRTGGWGGGEAVGLGLQARVGYAHRSHVRDWGWRT
ncbi:hypothetical protein B0H66DRAFT_515995 [Apodospora peruviana]|uniref:Uncharacterized protein n=1 Tax=Apodospora peruviana TaxID=516989 RepID=A0AAE0I3L9_9PEZI|nr:hypothetical protein B0H66DRAFT_515995 [Apodospora peruviana]